MAALLRGSQTGRHGSIRDEGVVHSSQALNIAGDMKYDLDNCACRNGEDVGEHTEVDTQLIAQQRKHYEQTDPVFLLVFLRPRDIRSSGLGDIFVKDAATTERRQWKQIEHR